jgi:hypothetical protein
VTGIASRHTHTHAHAQNTHTHTRVCVQVAAGKAASAEIVRQALAMGGTCSGEHGIGHGKLGYLVKVCVCVSVRAAACTPHTHTHTHTHTHNTHTHSRTHAGARPAAAAPHGRDQEINRPARCHEPREARGRPAVWLGIPEYVSQGCLTQRLQMLQVEDVRGRTPQQQGDPGPALCITVCLVAWVHYVDVESLTQCGHL